MNSRVLIFRLSSFGDILLSLCVLESKALQSAEVEWVVSEKFSDVLSLEKRIKKIWKWNRKKGFVGWVKLCWALANQGFDQVYDLHRTHRTRVASWVFRIHSIVRWKRLPQWRVVSKDRLRFYGFVLFKMFWPKAWRPRSWLLRFSICVGSKDILHSRLSIQEAEGKNKKFHVTPDHFAVMPSSAWRQKEWPTQNWITLLHRIYLNKRLIPVVLGTSEDLASRELVGALQDLNIPVVRQDPKSGVGELAEILSNCRALLSVDTGMVHLAEALGVPVFLFMGPTHPEAGFGVTSLRSKVMHNQLGCSPCGKSGKYCFRIWNPQACMKSFEVGKVYDEVAQFLIS